MSKSDSTSTPLAKKDATYRAGRDYQATDKGMIWWKPNGSGERVLTQLTDFNAWMVARFLMDDGQETTSAVRIEGVYEKKPFSILIPVKEFALMNWPIEHVDPRATVCVNYRERAREAIQRLSRKLELHHMYRHTGWREIDGEQVYLHAGGGIGKNGAVKVEVQLSYALRNYILPDPRRRRDVVQAVRASMKMLDIAPDRITFPVFATIWRAPIGNVSLSDWLSGLTGAQKSQEAALAQQHWGAKMDADHLPTNFATTPNANEALAFEAKDALMVVDDFVPMGSAADIQRMHRDADRLFRAQGNQAGKGRMNADTSLRPSKPPRGLLLGTGEDVPGGQSLRARLVVVEFSPGDIDLDKLTNCQQDAAEGKYAMAMAGYVKWLAPRINKVEKALQQAISAYRKISRTIGNHRRTPDNMANLMQGFQFWLSFATHVKAINPKQRAELWERACKAFDELITLQSSQQHTTSPTQQFMALIASAFTSGRAHLASQSGGPPPTSRAAFGWRREDGDPKRKWIPQGQKIGWVKDEQNIFLDPSGSFAVAQSLGKESGQFIPLAIGTLQRRLKQANMLASTDEARQTVTIRRTLEGTNRSVLHISLRTLFPLENPTNPTNSSLTTSTAFHEQSLEPDNSPTNPTNLSDQDKDQVSTSQSLNNLLSGLSGFPKGTPPQVKNGSREHKTSLSGRKSKPDKNVGFVSEKAALQYQTAAERRAERLRNI